MSRLYLPKDFEQASSPNIADFKSGLAIGFMAGVFACVASFATLFYLIEIVGGQS